MSGTYVIDSLLTHPTKYACMVSFNGHPSERYEIDLNGPFPEGLFPEEASDEEKVAAVLQLVADQSI